MCGEKFVSFLIGAPKVGSPPHVRGKDSYHMKGMAADRITPACAGKSYSWKAKTTKHKDHPRMCGEKIVAII